MNLALSGQKRINQLEDSLLGYGCDNRASRDKKSQKIIKKASTYQDTISQASLYLRWIHLLNKVFCNLVPVKNPRSNKPKSLQLVL